MNPRNNHHHTAFTLLELVVVLGILAIVTGLAVRALDGVEEQRRFEGAQRDYEELSAAILGSPEDRDIDGTPTLHGFVAHMGRLPRTKLEESPDGDSSKDRLTLNELWKNPGVSYDVRIPAIDPQVRVPGGWRGPYVRLPMGVDTLFDAWGNPMISKPTSTPSSPDARLRDINKNPITSAEQEIRQIWYLGANGQENETDSEYHRDEKLVISDDKFHARLEGLVEVRDSSNTQVEYNRGDKIIIRVFGPDPNNPSQILVYSAMVDFDRNPVNWKIPQNPEDPIPTIGPRVVRAYFEDVSSNPLPATRFRRSGVKNVTLRPGTNLLNLEIDRVKENEEAP